MAAKAHDGLLRLDTLTRSQVEAYEASYGAALSAKASVSKGGGALPELDAWYQALPALPLSSSSSGLLSGGLSGKPELVKLMQWKLSREKHRPTLLSLISSNPPSLCTSVLTRAAHHLSSCTRSQHLSLHSSAAELLAVVEGTMKILCELRGVGPATSSAIVASWVDFGLFQSDELALSLLKGVKVEYTMPFYRRFFVRAIETLKLLESQKVGVETGREMERVAWCIAHSPNTSSSGHTKTTADEKEKGNVEKKKEEGEQGPTKVVQKEMKVEGRAKRKTPAAAAAAAGGGHDGSRDAAEEKEGRRTSKRIRAKPAS